jgi:large subunit ribosomal protein L7/L12
MATRDEILESIANMTVMEVADLIKAMEEKFGVTAAAAAVAVAAGPAAAAEEVEEQTEFDDITNDEEAKKELRERFYADMAAEEAEEKAKKLQEALDKAEKQE